MGYDIYRTTLNSLEIYGKKISSLEKERGGRDVNQTRRVGVIGDSLTSLGTTEVTETREINMVNRGVQVLFKMFHFTVMLQTSGRCSF